jgi:hypothetical protein
MMPKNPLVISYPISLVVVVATLGPLYPRRVRRGGCRVNHLAKQTKPHIPCAQTRQDAVAAVVARLQTTTTATTLSASAVGGGGGDVLDTADLHAGTGQGTESRLGTGAGGLGAVTTSGTDLDVEGVDAELLACDAKEKIQLVFAIFFAFFLFSPRIFTYSGLRRPERPTWQRRGRTRHGRP